MEPAQLAKLAFTASPVALLFDLSLPVKVAVLAMAVAPIPPLLPGKQLKVKDMGELPSNFLLGGK